LADCPTCAEEQRLTLDIVKQLRSESDVAVPRHFFVNGEERRRTPWSLFQQLTWTWKAATAIALLVVGVLSAMAVSSFQIRTQADGITVSLGKPAEPKQSTAPSPVNVESLKADI